MSRVLVVDDDEGVREALARVLLSRNYEVDTAGCAAEALEKVASHPDIIILDLMLPDENGDILLSKGRLNGSAVIMLTAADVSSKDVVKILSHRNVYDVLGKPVDFDIFLAKVEKANNFVGANRLTHNGLQLTDTAELDLKEARKCFREASSHLRALINAG